MNLEVLEVLEVEHFLIYLLVELEVSPSSQLVTFESEITTNQRRYKTR